MIIRLVICSASLFLIWLTGYNAGFNHGFDTAIHYAPQCKVRN